MLLKLMKVKRTVIPAPGVSHQQKLQQRHSCNKHFHSHALCVFPRLTTAGPSAPTRY